MHAPLRACVLEGKVCLNAANLRCCGDWDGSNWNLGRANGQHGEYCAVPCQGAVPLPPCKRQLFSTSGRNKVSVRGLVLRECAMIKNRVFVGLLGLLLLLGMVAAAQKPARNMSGGRHPNLAAAQRLSRQAWE